MINVFSECWKIKQNISNTTFIFRLFAEVANDWNIFFEAVHTHNVNEAKRFKISVNISKWRMNMSNLSELELQNLRHLIGGYETSHCKMNAYAQGTQDAQVKQFFTKAAQSAMQNKQDLMQFLN